MTVHRNPPLNQPAALFDTDVYELLHTPDDRAPSFVHKVGNHLYEELPFVAPWLLATYLVKCPICSKLIPNGLKMSINRSNALTNGQRFNILFMRTSSKDKLIILNGDIVFGDSLVHRGT